jgi:signal transduction histidine kinase
MSKIGGKFFASFLGMAAVTIALLWLMQAGLFRDSTVNGRIRSVQRGLTAAISSGDDDWETLRQNLNINVLFFDQDGAARSISQGLPMMGMVVRACQAMIPDQADGSAQLVRLAAGSGRYAILGYAWPGEGYVFAVFSVTEFDETARALRGQLWLITAVLLACAVILAALLTRAFTRPIRLVTAAARDLAAGRYEAALPVRSHDEIGDLTTALNELSIQLQKTDNLRKELIANVSHELRAPLAIIQGYAETVRDVTWPDETKRSEQLGIIAGEAARLSQVVADILDYSRLQAGVTELSISDFAVCPLLDGLVRRLALGAAAKKLVLRCECQDLNVRFDRGKFEQVLVNLLHNAVNHAEPDSEVVVRAERQGAAVRIFVRNTGENIPAAELSRIWDRYYQAAGGRDGRQLGTGLGLAIVRSILVRHQVAFGVTSAGQETVFWFDTLPQQAP